MQRTVTETPSGGAAQSDADADAERERALIADLSRPDNLPDQPGQVEFLFTHGSLVFRTPRSVYKLKRARNYGFLDYTSLAAREHFCHEEVRLNRRGAPGVYLGVLPVFRDARGFSLNRQGGPGACNPPRAAGAPGSTGTRTAVADWVVHMRTLPDAASALSLVRAGTLSHEQLDAIALRLARFFASEETAPAGNAAAGALRSCIDENFRQAAPFAGRFVEPALLEDLRALHADWLSAHATPLARRRVRDGHGDLRLEHVYLLPDGPVFIDCIEFSERLRVADPALDVAFLAMDLCHTARADLAECLLARFAGQTDDHDLYALVDGYMSYRAFVRAKVACFVAADPGTPGDTASRKVCEARAFFELSRDLLRQPPRRPVTRSGRPVVLGVGGLIGAGKTTLANALCRALAMPVLSADATRKALAGLAPEQRGGAQLYTPESGARVFDEILRRADIVLQSGRSVLLDTTFQSQALRGRVRSLALRHGAAFLLLECHVPEAVARQRLRARTGGLSDAREDLLDSFVAGYERVSELPPEEHLVLETTAPPPALLSAVLARLESR